MTKPALLGRKLYVAEYKSRSQKGKRRRKTSVTKYDIMFSLGVAILIVAGILLGVIGPVA